MVETSHARMLWVQAMFAFVVSCNRLLTGVYLVPRSLPEWKKVCPE